MTDVECPHSKCEYAATEQGVKIHWGREHDQIPPWKRHICDWCGEPFERPPSQVPGENAFCNSECYGEFKSVNTDPEELPWYKGAKKTFVCDNCGDDFEAFQCFRETDRTEHTFCDRNCYGEWEQTDSGRPYYGPKWAQQRREALEQHEVVCHFEGCGRVKCRSGYELHLHHLEPLRKFDSFDEANRPENLVPLCAEHHAVVENKENNELLTRCHK